MMGRKPLAVGKSAFNGKPNYRIKGQSIKREGSGRKEEGICQLRFWEQLPLPLHLYGFITGIEPF